MNPKNSYGIVFGIAKIHLPGNYPIFISLCPRQNYVKWPMKLRVYTKNCRLHARFLTKTQRRFLSIVYCNIAGFEYCKAFFFRSTQQLSSTADMRRHNHQLHYRLRWQQNFIYNGKKKSVSLEKMQYGIFTIVKTTFKAIHCHAWSSQHKSRSLWSDQNTAQRASLF